MTARGAEYEVPGSASSRSSDGGQGRQIHFLRPLRLIQFLGAAEQGTGSIEFRVEVPDSRLRVNIGLIGVAGAATVSDTFIGTKALTLWLRAIEDAQDNGREVPITNLWGTSASPGAIPGFVNAAGVIVADTSLGGWGREFVTAGRAIKGTVNYPAEVLTGAGQLVLQVRYTPEAIRFPWQEWDEIRRACDRSCPGGRALTAS